MSMKRIPLRKHHSRFFSAWRVAPPMPVGFTATAPIKVMVLLIGNYAPDQQQSMLRFNQMMLQGLRDCGINAELIRPPAFFGRIRLFGGGIGKWLAYIDKFILFRWRLSRKLAQRPALVHICDHSNAPYARAVSRFPLVITCHDMLAVRGGLGEDTDCPASPAGRILQRWILRGLGRADVVACDSRATADDAKRLIATKNNSLASRSSKLDAVIPTGLCQKMLSIRDCKPFQI